MSESQTVGGITGRERALANLRPPWPAGVSGNPDGRPKTKPISDAYRRLAALPDDELDAYQPRTAAERIAKHQIKLASESQRVATVAAKEIADRTEGPVRLEVTGADGAPLVAPSRLEEILLAIAERRSLKP